MTRFLQKTSVITFPARSVPEHKRLFFSAVILLLLLLGISSVAMQPSLKKPSNLTATAASSSQINLSWKDNSNDEQGFKIERKTGAGGAYSQIATVPANTTTYSNAGLSSSTTYYYRVSGYSGTSNSNYSNEAGATTRGTAPSAPTGLTASPGNASVTLSWAASAGATSYNVKRSTASGGPHVTIATGVTTTSYTNTGLANGTTYYYVVSAVNANGEGANSAEASATPLAPPAAPNGLTATASGTQISLAWVASANATSYNVKRATTAGGPYASIATGVTTTGYTDGGLASGTTYYYVVSAVGGSGEGANSAEASATTAPAAPTGLTATAGNAQVSLAWSASAGASSYKVFRATSPGSYSSPLVSSITTTSYTDSTAVNGTTYYYVVRAANAAGDSASSNEVSATPINSPPSVSITNPANNASFTAPATITIDAAASDGDGTVGKVEFFQGLAKLGEDTSAPYSYTWSDAAVGNYTLTAKATDNGGATTTSSAVSITVIQSPPSAPTGLTATAASSSQINLNWTDNSNDETGFKIERKQGAGSSYAEVTTVGANVTTYNDTGLSAATQYYYRVRAHNAGVHSGYSNEANATTNDTAPAAPSGLTAAAASSSQVNLSWIDNSTNETGFKIERKTDAAGTYAQVGTVGAGVTTYSDMGLIAATQYYYRVRAHNAVGDSAYSDEANATTNGTPPAAPTGLTATPSGTQVTLAWAASTNATSYNVKRATTAGGPYASVVTGVTTTGYTNTGLANGTTYYYVVSAVNANGEGANSAEASAITAPAAPTGLTATAGNAQVSLAWNASTGATSYNVKRATTSGGAYTTIVTGVTTTSYADTGVTNGTTYYYVVAAVNASGESPNSAQASATPGVAPPAPTNLTAAAGNAQISLSWAASSGATSYNLYRGTSSGFTPNDSNRAAAGLTATSYTSTGLTNGTAYYFIVRAVNAAGESGNSNEAGATPSAGAGVGEWSAPFPSAVSGTHLHVLPTGKVMFHTNNTNPDTDYDPRLWDPATGIFTAAAMPGYNIYCSGHSFLPDGRLFFISGHIASGVGPSDASIYDPFTDSWTRTANMNAGRWYPTSTTLPNGDVLAISGRDEAALWNNVPQVWQKATGTWRDLSDAQLQLFYYPFMFVAPNGKVFYAGSTQITRYLDTSGTGSWTTVANTNFGDRGDQSTWAVMYDDGKVLIGGGADPPTATAEVINLNDASPAWRYVAPMAYPRRHSNATLLPDGKVLVTGGTSGPGFNNETSPVYAAEMWDPATESWTTMASMSRMRLYHSTAVLLPDGRVLAAGQPRGGATQQDAEIYSPPYLFKGARPTITSAPASVTYGQTFSVGTPDSANIAQITWIGLSSATHSFNQNQRINRLSFSRVAGGLNVTTPPNANLCPPGYYMLFILNGNGVPSVAKFIRIEAASVPSAPSDLRATVVSGARVDLAWNDSADNETSFRIERKTGAGGAYLEIGSVGANVTTYQDNTVSSGNTYYYRVRARNNYGDSGYSGEVSVTPGSQASGINFRGASTANPGNSSSITMAKPTAVVSGDVMVAAIWIKGGSTEIGTITPPPGWTLVRNENYYNLDALVTYYKVATSSEPAGYTWSFSTSPGLLGGIVAYSGVNQTTPVDRSAGDQSFYGSTSVPAPSVTTTVANTRMISFFAYYDPGSFMPPAGMTERFDISNSVSFMSFSADDESRPSAGPTGTRTAVASGAANHWITQTIALKP